MTFRVPKPLAKSLSPPLTSKTNSSLRVTILVLVLTMSLKWPRLKSNSTPRETRALSFQRSQIAKTWKSRMTSQVQATTPMYLPKRLQEMQAQWIRRCRAPNSVWALPPAAKMSIHLWAPQWEVISGRMNWMLHIQSKHSCKLQDLVSTQSTKRKTTSKPDCSKKKPFRLPSASKKSVIATKCLRLPTQDQVPTLTSTIQTTLQFAKVSPRSGKTGRWLSLKASKLVSLALTQAELRTVGCKLKTRTLVLAPTTPSLFKTSQHLTWLSTEGHRANKLSINSNLTLL